MNLLPSKRFRPAILGASLVAALATSCSTSPPIGKPAPVSAAAGVLAELRATEQVRVYEGLPHQAHEAEVLQKELRRRDVTRIGGYPFYTPSKPARNASVLRRILGDPGSFAMYRGPKTCGGFHPDYAVTWQAGGPTRSALICFGCGEMLLSADGSWLPYNIRDRALAELRTALAPYAAKRPPGGP